jgi:hypothetical protein
LAELDASFDLASPGEIALCRGAGIPSHRLSFGNTIKRESTIGAASRDGIGLFAFDSAAELEKLARCAPHGRVRGRRWEICRSLSKHRTLQLGTRQKWSSQSSEWCQPAPAQADPRNELGTASLP